MDRVPTDALFTAFFPTCMLWLLAYLTLFIKIEDFNERIMVAVTVLLVLAALLSSINGNLPDTPYFMNIDIWFLWYTANIFAITVFHILLKEIVENGSGKLYRKKRVGTNGIMAMQKTAQKSKQARVNDMAKKLFLIAFLIFNAIYFPLQVLVN